jgi:uncharacterized protein YijF (DUF1287 family)
MKFLLRFIIFSAAVTGILVVAFGYHGPRTFTSIGALPPVEKVVQNARSLSGTPYDPLMGRFGDIGANIGFIVCSDVPNIAYGLSGYSLQKSLEDDFTKHKEAYDVREGNVPKNPYFHRRARNLYAYFVANGALFPSTSKPISGDLAFYRSTANGAISHVSLVTEVTLDSYKVMESAPETIWAQEMPGDSPGKRGWILAGFGRIYGDNVTISGTN